MTDTTTEAAATPDTSVHSVVAPSGGAGEGVEAEMAGGKTAAEKSAKRQHDGRERREREHQNAIKIAGAAAAAGDKDAADKAEKIRGMVKSQPVPGPGMPKVSPEVIAATMDPNNPVLNPDVSRLGAQRDLPPGARVPAPVLPQDTVQTQFVSKPPTDEHAKAGEETSANLEPYPPISSQPSVPLTEEQAAEADKEAAAAESGGQPSQPAAETPPDQQPPATTPHNTPTDNQPPG